MTGARTVIQTPRDDDGLFARAVVALDAVMVHAYRVRCHRPGCRYGAHTRLARFLADTKAGEHAAKHPGHEVGVYDNDVLLRVSHYAAPTLTDNDLPPF